MNPRSLGFQGRGEADDAPRMGAVLGFDHIDGELGVGVGTVQTRVELSCGRGFTRFRKEA